MAAAGAIGWGRNMRLLCPSKKPFLRQFVFLYPVAKSDAKKTGRFLIVVAIVLEVLMLVSMANGTDCGSLHSGYSSISLNLIEDTWNVQIAPTADNDYQILSQSVDFIQFINNSTF